MKRTPQQQKTIDAPHGNILVSAAAGSGKTSVMTERIVTRIVNGELDIRNILVMTFTDAAAKSMSEKIEKRLREALLNAQNMQLSAHLSKQLAFLKQGFISTIHAFCLDVIRNFYYEATDENGKVILEPGFRIEDQGEAGILLSKALDSVMERQYISCDIEPLSQETKHFLNLVDSYGSSKTDAPLKDLLSNFYHFLRSMPDYIGWIKTQLDILNRTLEDFDNSACYKTIYNGLILRLKRASDAMPEFRSLIYGYVELYKDKKKNDAAMSTFKEFIGFIEDAATLIESKTLTWDEVFELFHAAPLIPNLKRSKTDSLEKTEILDLFDNNFAELMHFTTGEYKTAKYKSKYVFDQSFVFYSKQDEILNDMKSMKPVIIKFCEIILLLDKEYNDLKFASNMIDFGDFEHIALKILKAPQIQNYYKGKFKEIYLDEYQDTSSIQEAILELVSSQNCFMVGDVKQSIYKFRHARPQIFMNKYNTFESDGFAKSGSVYELNKNFRSVCGILNAVNNVFYQIMSTDAGEIEYNEAQSLITHREDDVLDQTPVEVMLIDISVGQKFTKENDGVELPAGDRAFAEGNEVGLSSNGFHPSLEGNESVNKSDNEDNNICSSDANNGNTCNSDRSYKMSNESSHYKYNDDKNSNGSNEHIENSDNSESEESSKNAESEWPSEDENATDEPNDATIKSKSSDDSTNGIALTKEESSKYAKEALGVAVKISELISQGIKPGQIAVLARTKNICDVFTDTIKSLGIPSESDKAQGFLELYELKIIESFLRILDNPMQDIPLVSVMKSSIFGSAFSEEELLTIRILKRDIEFFHECCKNYRDNGSDEILKEKLNSFYSWLDEYRWKLDYLSTSEIMEVLFTSTGFLAKAGAKPDGALRILSLQQFLDWARNYDLTRQAGLNQFIKYMDSIHDKSQDKSPFGVEESTADAVKIMTMHKSKGLEYEVVFLVGNDRRISPKGIKDKLLFSEELGIGFNYVNLDLQYSYPTPLVFAMQEKMRTAELAEEMRLFYVGMTRAMNRLFITGTCKPDDNVNGKGFAPLIDKVRSLSDEKPVPSHMVLSAKSTLEWILMSISRNPFIDFEPLGISPYKNLKFKTEKGDPEILLEVATSSSPTDSLFHSKSWSVSVVNFKEAEEKAAAIIKNAVNQIETDDSTDQNSKPFSSLEDFTKQFEGKFEFSYPFKEHTQKPLKISVSEIKRTQGDGSSVFETQGDGSSVLETTQTQRDGSSVRGINTSMKELDYKTLKTLGSREAGIAVHSFIRYMNLDLLMNKPDIETIVSHLTEMRDKELINEIEFNYLANYTGYFLAYIESSLAQRIYIAKKKNQQLLYREMPFTMKLEDTFVQGMIDCWFIEDNQAVLVDYKTDKINASKDEIMSILKTRYKTQLFYYSQAITKVTGLKVKEAIIWLMDAKTSFTIEI